MLPFWIYAVLAILLADYSQRQKGLQRFGALALSACALVHAWVALVSEIKAMLS